MFASAILLESRKVPEGSRKGMITLDRWPARGPGRRPARSPARDPARAPALKRVSRY